MVTTAEQGAPEMVKGEQLTLAGPTPVYETITPAQAAEWLEANLEEGHNRSLRRERAEAFARDMESGNWRDNGETLKFDWNGRLVDGQHRLAALVRAGIPHRFLVVRGVDPDSIHTIDMGVARRYADVLRMNGVRNGAQMASMERRLFLWKRRGMRVARGGAAKAVTSTELLEFREGYHQLLGLALSRGQDLRKKFARVSPSTFGAAYILFTEKDPAMADAFFDMLLSGVGFGDDRRHPVLVLRERLADGSRQFEAKRTSEDEKLALMIRAWNHFRDGKPVATLYVTLGGKPLTDETMPEPK